MTQNKANSGTGGGLQPVPGKTLAGDVQNRSSGEFVEMQELLPVMSSFQEHLAAEQRKHQGRMRSMIFLFVVLFGVFLIVPVYMGKVFLAQSRANLDAQSAAQEKLAQSLSKAMNSLADASRGLRDELALQRATRGEGSAPAPAVAAQVPEPEAPVKPSEPPPKEIAQAQPVEETEVTPTLKEVKPEATAMAPIELPVVAAAPVKPAEPAAAKENLEILLKQVEDAIAQKEREMRARAK